MENEIKDEIENFKEIVLKIEQNIDKNLNGLSEKFVKIYYDKKREKK